MIDAVRSKVNDVSLGGGGEIPDLAQLCESLVNLVQDDQPDRGHQKQRRPLLAEKR